jgi:ATP-dependent exoDNAse (exonuclease V) beta subunit
MARLLAKPHGNITVAGDPYQSIYSFRGAELRNIDDFQKGERDVRRIVLDKSFRVPAEIMDAALRVVSSGDLPGAAGPVTPAAHSGRVETYVFDQATAEAEWIAAEVEHSIRHEGVSPSAIAILTRSKREMLNEMSRALTRRKIQHNRPDRRLIDHPAVQFVSDLVTIATRDSKGPTDLISPIAAADIDSAARRILLGPLVGATLGLQREMSVARRRGAPWAELFGQFVDANDIGSLLAEPSWATDRPASDGFWHAWTTVTAMAQIVDEPERHDWRRALSSFSQVLDRQADRNPDLTLEEFFHYSEDESFEATPLLSHKSSTAAVVLTTLHQAKGLEFETVFIANAVEGVFPDLRRSRRMLRPELLSPERTADGSAQSQFQVQEEMRLAYTAMTRARRRVVWTATDAGVDQGEQRPSRFLVAASGSGSLTEIGRPEETDRLPVTITEMEALLRRTASDPAKGLPSRLAAMSILAESPKHAWSADRFAGIPAKGPDSPILEGTLTMSPSRADGYSRCPRRYAIERRLRVEDPTSVWMQQGNLVHHALEVAERAVIGTGRPHNDVTAAIDALREAWQSSDFGTPQLTKAWLAKAETIISRLYETWPPSGAVPIALEKRVSLEVGGVLWQGYIDRLEESPDGLRVVDYKTGSNMPTKEEASTSIQLGFYALALNAEPEGPNVVAAELWFPAKDSKSLSVRSLDMARLPEITQAMTEVTARVLAEDWEPRVSSNCKRCAYRTSCPAWPEGRGAFVA